MYYASAYERDRRSSSRHATPELEIKDSAAVYETERIKVLQQERVYVQKKTFTKWCNSYLEKVNLGIQDLFSDLCDGKTLMNLLVIISGELFGRPNRGVLRVQKMENVSRCLQFLATKVTFENIGPEDIVDGNPTLILGLIWTIILRFQIQDIVIEVSDKDNIDKINAKDALLLWCQRKTNGYRGVKIENFTTSWRSGLGFNALIHSHRPDLIDYDSLDPNDHIGNLNNAFTVAEEQLGIKRLLDPEDMDVARPDDKSVMTYVASYYHYFAKMKSQMTDSKRINNVLASLMDIARDQDDYEFLVTNLLEWINRKIEELNDRNFPNSLEGIKMEMNDFTSYRVKEKPPKYKEKGNIEVLFFNIQAKLKSGQKKMYVPPEGKLIRDIESSWIFLEKAEHDREIALREELIRQEKLKRLAEKFERKAILRESWLNDMMKILSDQNFANNTSQVEAALKKHEAIAADVESRRDRFIALSGMVQELYQENYHGKQPIKEREKQILAKWQQLLEMLDKKKKLLNGFGEMLGMFREVEGILAELKQMEPTLKSEDIGRHLDAVENLLQQHSLIESQLNNLSDRVKRLNQRALPYKKSLHPEAQILQKRLEPLNKEFENTLHLSHLRKSKLEESQTFFQLMQDFEDQDAWLTEATMLAKSHDVGKDLASCTMLIKRHEALEQEMAARVPQFEKLCSSAERLIGSGHPLKSDLKAKVAWLKSKWESLREQMKARKTLLDDALESHQYYADANEAESWMREKMPLVTTEDFGRDQSSAENLSQRHNRLDGEIKTFEQDIKRLDQLASLMTKASSAASGSKLSLPASGMLNGNNHLEDVGQPSVAEVEAEVEEEWIEVPYEYEVEEIKEQPGGFKEEVVERSVPQIKALYSYKGNGMEAVKGEILLLLEKTNSDWWKAQRENGQHGYLPSNYVKEVEPRIIKKIVRKPTDEPVKVKVKKTGYKKELVRKKKPTNLRRKPSARSQANLHFDKVNLEKRQQAINNSYKTLSDLSQARKKNLEDSIAYFQFCTECDYFEEWMDEKEQLLLTKESLSENMEAIKKKYELLITDMAANSHRIDDIDDMANKMVRGRHLKTQLIKKKQADINDKWNRLNELKRQKEKSLAGASGIELFQKLCEELKEWIHEKNNGINLEDVGKDLKSVQVLKRRHQNLESELRPLEEKLNKMNLLAQDVRKSHPDEAPHVNQREKEIMGLWRALKDKAAKHKKLLDDAEELFKFREDSKDLENRLNDIKERLREKTIPHSPAEADDLLKRHEELREDVNDNRERLQKLVGLAEDILAKDPNNKEVWDSVRKLQSEQKMLEDAWEERGKELMDAKKYQAFLKDANQLESQIASQNAFLDVDINDLDMENLDALKKRQDEMESALKTQEEKMKSLQDLANKMIRERHPESKTVQERVDSLKAKLDASKKKLLDRKNRLAGTQAFQEFKRDADELSDWIQTKYILACDESYRDLTNLLPKLQKHQALEAEVRANHVRLEDINKTGEGLVKLGHHATPEVKKTLVRLKNDWKQLDDKVKDKGLKLRQAAQQELFNKALEDANAKLSEMERLLKTQDLGKDLRGAKHLLYKHQMLENEMAVNAENLRSIVEQGNKLAKDGHFDSKGILQAVKEFDNRFKALEQPIARRRHLLEESLKQHQYLFDVETELQWIKDHLPGATSIDYGRTLVDTINLHAKHKKLEMELQGHQPQVDKVLSTGSGLVKAKHFASHEIKARSDELSSAWRNLLQEANIRRSNLESSMEKHKFLSEANDILSWLTEKHQLLSGNDFGRDSAASDSLLTKHKVIESEVKTHAALVRDLGKRAAAIQQNDESSAKDVSSKQSTLEDLMSDLERKCRNRRKNLEGSKLFHDWLNETEELDEWIAEQMVQATSEEYGQDYEHLQVVLNKFSEFQLGIEAGSKRFVRVDEMANSLIEGNNPNKSLIIEKQDRLMNAWQDLLEHVESRSQKLHGAGELHRFNRDVEDALTRIQEKYSGMSEDLGKDLKTTQSYIKKHEAFENELLALEAQLQILFYDSERLQQTYPGGNAEHISGQQEVVYSNWIILKDKSNLRRSNLLAQLDYYLFTQAIRSLHSWAEETMKAMRDDTPARNVAMATEKIKEHDEARVEIDARQETFDEVVGKGQKMAEEKHIMTDDIKEKLLEIVNTREMLEETWHRKKKRLEEALDQQLFLRDANQLEAISNTQEAYLKGVELGSTPDQVETLMRKHEAFENVLNSQDGKLMGLKEFAERLLCASPQDSKEVKETIKNVTARRSAIKDLSHRHRDKLSDNLLYAQFNRDVVEAEGWIDERLRVAKEENFKNVKDLQEKMKSLKKHQVFEAEIMANAEKIKSIKMAGESLLKRRHPHSSEIQQRVNTLIQNWNDLLKASNERGKGLEEVKDILKFNEEVDKVEAWIREKELLVAACDLGRDYEHCLELQRKVDDVEGGIAVDEERIASICKLADKLLHQGRTDTKLIKEKKANMLTKWNLIQGALNDHRKKLEMALEIHSFNRDMDDISDRINEKHLITVATLMSSHDYGRNLASIQALIRKQEEVEKDMTAIHLQIKKMEQLFVELSQKYPSMITEPQEKLSKVKAGWTKLGSLAASRKLKLEDVYLVFRFFSDAEEQISWCRNMAALINSGNPGTNVREAEQQLQSHLEKKTEITGRQDNQRALMDRAKKISSNSNFKVEEVQKVTKDLERAWMDLNNDWTQRKTLLAQRHDFQVYESFADQADQWMATKEAFLANEDLGDSPSSVDDLIKKHDSFTTTLEAQCEKLSTLEQLAHELLKQQHYASDQIQARLKGVMERWEDIKRCSELRRMRLNDSKDCQSFLISIHDVQTWIREKMQLAMDESYRDPFNLKGKIQKHQAFQAEVVANRRRVDVVVEEGEGFISSKHYASPEIKEQMAQLEAAWSDLLLASEEKRKRLEEAYESLDFQRQCDDLEAWMDEVEGHLASEDHGRDVITVQNLLKKHQVLEEDISKKQEKLSLLRGRGQEFKKRKHFMADELVARARQLNERYQNLTEPCQIRRDNLEDSLMLHTFFRDAEDELGWMAEKMPLAANKDLGDNLNSVLSLQKKHQALENEIVAREPLIEAAVSMASHMIEKKHPASDQIQERLKMLLTEHSRLKRLSKERKNKLLDAVESQTFYVESEEAKQWIAEKKTYLTSRDLGKDEDSVQVLLKKLEALVLDIENFSSKIEKLDALNQGLVARDHFDKENIKKHQTLTEMRYKELLDLATARKAKLSEKKLLFEFLRESEEVLRWIEEKSIVAGSDDYGTDIEHVQILQQRFNDFVQDLDASEEKISNINALAEGLLSSNHSETSVIKTRCQNVNQTWNEVKELARARLASLEGAKKVHAFVRDADDAIEWMDEKSLLACSEEYGQDIQSVNTLIVKHKALEQDLAAIKKQVDAISNTAEKLLELIPDAREHIEPKLEELQYTWINLKERAALRLERLHQMEDVQIYFDDYRGLCAWCNEMQARITADELAHDVAGAELLVSRHKENKVEIDKKVKEKGKFEMRGRALISEKNFLAAQIQGKIDHLEILFSSLLQTWEKRRILYDQSLDLEVFKRDADLLEEWLSQKKPTLEDRSIGDSIEAVEFLIQKHEDFEKMVYAQEDRFSALKRFTLLEDAFSKQKRDEEKLRMEEERRKERERQEELKRKEQERILEERRKEEDHRKLQDIRRLREADDVDNPDQKLSKDEVSQLIKRQTSFENDSHLSPTPTLQPPPLSSQSSPQHAMTTSVAGLKTSDAWKDDGTPVRKKVARTDSQKKEKRQRTLSMKTNKKPFECKSQGSLPPVDISGFLERKHQYQKGKTKATIRSWKPYYTVLCGQLLCFFRDEKDYMQQAASAPPLAIHGALCEAAQDYTRKKNVFRLALTDGSEYLFMAQDGNQMGDWVSQIKFHADQEPQPLHPAFQLLKYNDENGGQHLFSDNQTNLATGSSKQIEHEDFNEGPSAAAAFTDGMKTSVAISVDKEGDASARKDSISGEAPPLPTSIPPPHSPFGGSYPPSESEESNSYGSLTRSTKGTFEIQTDQAHLTAQERPCSAFGTMPVSSPTYRSSVTLETRSSLTLESDPKAKSEKKSKHGFFSVFGKKKDKDGKKVREEK